MNHSPHQNSTSSTRLPRRDLDALALRASASETSASDALAQHDALQKRRWKRALLASLCVNVVAWSAFLLWKNVPQSQATSENAPLTWSIETSPLPTSPPKSSTRTAALLSSRAEQASHAQISSVAYQNREPKTAQRMRASANDFQSEPTESRAQLLRLKPSRSAPNLSASKRFRATTRNSERVVISNNFAPTTNARNVAAFAKNRSETSNISQSNDRSSLPNRALESGFGGDANVRPNANGGVSKNGAKRNGSASGDSANSAAGNANLAASAASSNSPETAPAETASNRPDATTSTRSAPETPRETPRNESRETTRTAKPEVTHGEKAPEPKPAAPISAPIPRRRVVREAEVLQREKVRVPRRLRREKRKASVVIETEIDEKGRANPRVKESSGDRELDEVVLKAARKTRFKPREEDGVATKSTKSTRYDVDVKDGDENSDNDEDDKE